MDSPAASPVAFDTAIFPTIDNISPVLSWILYFLFFIFYNIFGFACFEIGITVACPIFWFLDWFRRRERALTGGEESYSPNQCYLLDSNVKGPGGEESLTSTNMNQVQEELSNVVAHMEDSTDFSADHLRSLYSSLLYGLVDSDDEQMKQDVDKAVSEAIGGIDTNGDGIIDVWEMEHISLPRDAGAFLFDDVVACSSTADSAKDACVSANDVVDFINMFYGGAEIISADLAEHIRQMSGSDACYTRDEFEAVFTTAEDLDTLSAGLSSHPMDLSFVLSMAFGVGTALFVSGLSSPF